MNLAVRVLVSLAAVMCVSPVPVLGQTVLGVRGGLTRATLSGAERPYFEGSRSRIRLGVAVAIPISRGVGVRFGGDYLQAGGGLSYPDLGFGIDLDHATSSLAGIAPPRRPRDGIELDYVRLSALARAGPQPESRRVAAYVLAGPFIGFGIGCAEKISGASLGLDCDGIGVSVSDTDFGISGGVGVEVRASTKMRVAIEASYDAGLRDIGYGAKTRVFSLLAGLSYSL